MADPFPPAPQSFGTLKPYTPSLRDRLIGAMQNMVGGTANQRGTASDFAENAGNMLNMVPGVSNILGADDAVRQYQSGHPIQAALTGAMALPFPAAPVGALGKAMRNLPNLRNLPVAEATEIAGSNPHLIPAGAGSPGGFVGGPANIKNMQDLTNQRNAFDAYVAQNPAGGDWYDRARAGISSVTGNQPIDNRWMSKLEGQMSAGVSPEGELGFALKENSGQLAGMPVKAARPAQHQALADAIAANDPNLMARGQKTGMYAQKINPDQPNPPGATGVNDFRMARQLGYTDASGQPTKVSVKGAPQTFMDYETANAVARANEANLGGRSNWTGEQLQAAPWVHQKANALVDQRPALTQKYVDQGMDPTAARAAAYGDAFKLANTTIADYFPKHTAFATHEAIPGADTGHLPGSIGAPLPEREAYTADPRSTWANAPGGRDAIYGGLRVGDTGVAGRVLPTQPMTGMYTPPSGVTESNPGFVARPLVAIQNGPKGGKSIAPADRALLEGGEMTRAYIDAQNAGAAHKLLQGVPPGQANSRFVPLDRSATTDEIQTLKTAMEPHGLPDVVDTGQGLTVTNFGGASRPGSKGARDALTQALASASPKGAGAPTSFGLDSIYAGLEDAWPQGVGSGAATDRLLDTVSQNPQMEAAFSNNQYIPGNAADRAARDVDWQNQWGPVRPDIQTARGIIGQGPGWVDRLRRARAAGVSLPAIGAGALVLPQAFPRAPGDASSQ